MILNVKHCFVGYTTYFKCRNRAHLLNSDKTRFNGPNAMLFDFVKNNGDWSTFEMSLIETRKFDGRLDAKRIRWDLVVASQATPNGPTLILSDKVQMRPPESERHPVLTTPVFETVIITTI